MMIKKTNKALALCSHLTLFSLLMSVACTHQQDKLIGDNDLASYSDGASTDVAAAEPSQSDESATATPPSEDLAALAESDSSGSVAQEMKEETKPTEETSSDSAVNSDLSTLANELSASPVPSAAPSEALSSEPALLPSPSDAASASLAPATSSMDTLPMDATASTVPTESTEPTLVNPAADTTVLPDAVTASNPDTLPVPKVNEEKTKVKSTLPRIPTGTVTKKGQALNRFYFLRQGDTAQSLSTLFYGSTDHEKELVTWNGKVSSWKTGSLLYFVSADQPDDIEMTSFYDESGVEPEAYTVKAGDQLSTIAQAKYGSSQSWKEIAALNKLANPDRIDVGQELALAPTQLKSIQAKPAQVTAQLPTPVTAQVVAAAPVAPQMKVLTEEDMDGAGGFPAVEKSAIPEAAVAVAQPLSEMQKAKDANLAAMELGQPEPSNLMSFALGGGLFAMALFLFLVRRARARARAEFMD